MSDLSGRPRISHQVWEKVAFTVIAALIAAGVTALFRMNDSVARLEERVGSWTQIYEKRIDGFERANDRRFERVYRAIDEIRQRQKGN